MDNETLNLLLDDNKKIKEELEATKARLEEITNFNRALLATKPAPVSQDDETLKAKAKLNAYINGEE